MVFLAGCWLLLPFKLAGQGENDQWLFGRRAGLDFRNGAPVALDGGQTDGEVSAAVCDADGSLLFYTDGRQLWDRQHRPMPGGNELRGAPGRPQSTAIVPVIDRPGCYYLFTVSPRAQGGVLRYSVVDMNQNGGFGAVLPEQKNLILDEGYYPVLATAKAACGVWLIAHKVSIYNVNVFYAYLIDFDGIDFPVITSHDLTRGSFGFDELLIALSPNGRQLALAATYRFREEDEEQSFDTFLLFEFINEEGKIVVPRRLDSEGFQDIRGLAFSPDSRLLYANERDETATRALYQYDLAGGEATSIRASRQRIGAPACPDCLGAIRLGPDGRLYIAQNDQPWLALVANPNVRGPQCGFQDQGVGLGSGRSGVGLPDRYIANFQVEEPLPFRDTLFCRSGLVEVNAASGFDTYAWQDGSSGPAYTIRSPGQYRLEASYEGCPIRDTIDARGYLETDGLLGSDTTICPGEALELNLPVRSASDYRWEDGSRGPRRRLQQAGAYWVEYDGADGCPVRDSLLVDQYRPIYPELGPDTLLCHEATLLLDPGVVSSAFRWQDGSPEPTYQVRSPGLFRVTVNGPGGCSYADSIRIDYSPLTPIELGPPVRACDGERVTLDIGRTEAARQIRWQDGSAAPTFTTGQSGTYHVRISDGACAFEDEVTVTFRDCCTLYVPNAFSPNGDGVNDRFEVAAGCPLAAFRLQIFSRLGQRLYDSQALSEGWDGRFGPGDAPSGVYLYRIDYRFERDDQSAELQKMGHLTLLR